MIQPSSDRKAYLVLKLISDIQKMLKKPTQTQQDMLSLRDNQESKPHNKFYQFFIEGKVASLNKQENNNASLIINVLCQFFFLAHTVVAQQLISQEQFAPFFQQIIQTAISEVFVYKTLQIFSIILKLLIIQSIYMEVANSQQIIGLSWLKRIIMKSFFTMKEVDAVLSNYLLFVSWSQNLFLFVFSLLIDGFYIIYLQNYVVRKDLFYITSSFQNSLLRISIALSIASNIILVNVGNQFSFTLYHIFFVSALLTWYFKWGYKIYTHHFVNRTSLVIVTVYGAFVFSLAEKLFTHFDVVDVDSISKFILSFSVLTAFFILGQSKAQTCLYQNPDANIKDYELFVATLAQKSIGDQDAAALLFGKLYIHCSEGTFEQGNEILFDPLLKTPVQINRKKLASQRESTYRFYCKFYYERLLARNPPSKKLLLDYSEFLYNQMRNVYLLIQVLEKTEGMDLNIIERIKVTKIKLMIKEQNQRLNSELYDGKLQLENIIQSQQCFEKIQSNIIDSLNGNLQVLGFLFQPELDLSEMRRKLVQNFSLVEQTSKLWMKLSKYFNCHKQWKFSYLNYLLFIKNQHIKLKQFDDSKGDHNGDLNNSKIFIDETNSSTKELFSESILFNEGSFCIKTHFDSDQLVIHEASRFFEKNTMYSVDEIKGTLLGDLLPVDLRQNHSIAVSKWITEGYLIDDSAYKVRFTKCLKKNGDSFPVIKYYKSHLDIQKGLVFICLLKQNTKPFDGSESVRFKPLFKELTAMRKISNQESMAVQQLNDDFSLVIETKNIHSESNIFIKEQTLQPPKRSNNVQNFKKSSRIFTLSIVVSILLLLLINQNTTSNLISYGNQFITYMNVYRYAYALGTGYLKYSLNVGSAKVVAIQIATNYNNMRKNAASSNTIKTLFDPTLAVPALYAPYYQYPWMQNQTYNQIDLLYLIYSLTTTLSQLPFNRTGKQFQQFNSFIHPAYNNMMNGTKFQLQAQFQTLFNTMINAQLWFMLAQGLIFLIFVIISFYYVHKSIVKMKRFFLIMTDFTVPDLQKITDYWVKLSLSFQNIFRQIHNEERQTRPRSSRRSYNLIDKFIGKQSKRNNMSSSKPMVVQGKTRRKYECILYCLIIMTAVLMLTLVLILESNIILSIQKEQKFQIDGFFFLKYFPTGPLGYGVLQKYYSLLYPAQINFNPDRYADILASMYLFGKINYIGSMNNPSSLYYAKQKNYFFGNLCQQNIPLLTNLNVTQASCQTLSNGTFKQGGSAFLRYGTKLADNYINGKITLSPAQLQNYTLSIVIVSNFAFDAIITWLNQFSNNVNADFSDYFAASIIISVLIVILHIVLNEILIVHKIQEDYKLICRAYGNLVPEYILINEKVLRQKFVIEGLISE